MSETEIEWNTNGLAEGDLIQLRSKLSPIMLIGEQERFIPDAIYVRKEMCQVFTELTKDDRALTQILIGSPGVGKSVLLLVVALHRVLTTGIPAIFVRKKRAPLEFVSVFFMKKINDTRIKVKFDRSVDSDVTVKATVGFLLSTYEERDAARAYIPIVLNEYHLYIDGLHEGDPDLNSHFHYLCTSGGYTQPHGELSQHTKLVILEGWSKASLKEALTSMKVIFLKNEEVDEEDDGGETNVQGNNRLSLDEIFYHTGGRIREVFQYVEDPADWKELGKKMVDTMGRDELKLCIFDTKGSGDPKSPDRIRTLFRTGNPDKFYICVQIVDSQFLANLVQDRCGLEQYYYAYKQAIKANLQCAAGIHFEELVHQLFRKRPAPIEKWFKSSGTGTDGVTQLNEFKMYWIPSIPNFANIDAALVLNTRDSVSLWCFQYTISNEHMFNAKTFKTKFLRPVTKTFGLSIHDIAVHIVFLVPHNVVLNFGIPSEVVEETSWESMVKFVDCSADQADLETLTEFFTTLPCLDASRSSGAKATKMSRW